MGKDLPLSPSVPQRVFITVRSSDKPTMNDGWCGSYNGRHCLLNDDDDSSLYFRWRVSVHLNEAIEWPF